MGQTRRIEALKIRHEQLETIIETEEARPHPDEVELHALKKEKLRIKDEISSHF